MIIPNIARRIVILPENLKGIDGTAPEDKVPGFLHLVMKMKSSGSPPYRQPARVINHLIYLPNQQVERSVPHAVTTEKSRQQNFVLLPPRIVILSRNSKALPLEKDGSPFPWKWVTNSGVYKALCRRWGFCTSCFSRRKGWINIRFVSDPARPYHWWY